ncbi:chaperone ClpB [Carpediemonas membranifera]|uniref:Chaperone ClpB n=1 Tax=Carpediemonas membranifera TaxID=201153 RepID=A0A8J6DZF1_9EUKA|nr:chaperone ClpB [Carpediemonas membranifera]|eukprot:KAG9390638.1 chaperone ClpB [Carpediemonas membranifera]
MIPTEHYEQLLESRRRCIALEIENEALQRETQDAIRIRAHLKTELRAKDRQLEASSSPQRQTTTPPQQRTPDTPAIPLSHRSKPAHWLPDIQSTITELSTTVMPTEPRDQEFTAAITQLAGMLASISSADRVRLMEGWYPLPPNPTEVDVLIADALRSTNCPIPMQCVRVAADKGKGAEYQADKRLRVVARVGRNNRARAVVLTGTNSGIDFKAYMARLYGPVLSEHG